MATISYRAGAPTQGGGDPILQNGRYRFRVVEAELEKSKAGNDMVEFKARHIKEDESLGRAVYGRLVFTAKALWRVDQFLSACGHHPGKDEDAELDTDDMIGWEFEADVVISQDDKNRDRNEFENFVIQEGEPF